MESKLEKRYPLPVDGERAWAVLRDVKAVAGCMPGATLGEPLDDAHYPGSVQVKLGPATGNFAGMLEVVGLDEVSRRLQLRGRGADKTGSTAAMDMTATIEAGDGPGSCVLFGVSTITVSGKFAQFGARLMGPMTEVILGQFVDNFAAVAAAVPASDAADGTRAAPAAGELDVIVIIWSLIKSLLATLFGRRA